MSRLPTKYAKPHRDAMVLQAQQANPSKCAEAAWQLIHRAIWPPKTSSIFFSFEKAILTSRDNDPPPSIYDAKRCVFKKLHPSIAKRFRMGTINRDSHGHEDRLDTEMEELRHEISLS